MNLFFALIFSTAQAEQVAAAAEPTAVSDGVVD